MGDQSCHRNNKTNRPMLTLGGERCEYTGEPLANFTVRERLAAQEAKEQAIREDARKRVEAQQRRRELAQERREFRQQAAAEQAERDHYLAERRREKWLELTAEAAELGFTPDSSWNEREFIEALRKQRRAREHEEFLERERRGQLEWQRREQARARRFRDEVMRHSIERNAALKRLLTPEDVGDEWADIPHVARHGIARCKSDPWDRIGWEHWSKPQEYYQARGRHRLKAAVAMAEYLGQWLGRRSSKGRGMRPQQKQSRTWERAAPRTWRRKDQCAARWNHLFD